MTKVFVSYSSKDQSFVLEQLIPRLEDVGIEPWCSATSIRTAANWERQIRSALAECDWFIVVLSPDAQRSDWVQAETHWAIENLCGRVIPLMIGNCTPTEIHLLLGTIQFIDGRADHAVAMSQLVTWMQNSTGASETPVVRRPVEALLQRTVLVARPRYAVLSARLVAEGRMQGERHVRILNRAIIGRSPDVELRIGDSSVSRKHACIDVIPGECGIPALTLTDLDSSNGTFINGSLIQTTRGFCSGDVLSFGDAQLHVEEITAH